MAYSFSSSIVVGRYKQRRSWAVTITELEAGAAASEWSVSTSDPSGQSSRDYLPLIGRIVNIKATITAGTGVPGATIDPLLGNVVTFTTASQGHIWTNGTAAAHIDEEIDQPFTLVAGTPTLFGRSVPSDTTADHTVVTELLIVEGAES